MRTLLDRTHIGFAILLTAAALIASPAGHSQTPSAATDPAGFDIGGIKLGMTLDEATAALKAFDPAFTITRKYLHGAHLSFGIEGQALDYFPMDERNTLYLNDIVAEKGAPTRVCSPPGSPYCSNHYDENPETVTVWFTRVPGQERVIAVQRGKSFVKDPKPAIPSLRAGIIAKYPEPHTTFEFTNGWVHVTGWLFGPKGQLLSRAAVKNKGLTAGGGLPQFVRAGDGVGLNVSFTSTNTNDQLAEQFTLALFDAGALYKSIEQGKTAYDALKAQADAKQLEQSNKGAAPTKF